MLRFSVLVPDATLNYIKNPSMRYGTTDWNSSGSTLSRTLDEAHSGIASLKVVTAGTVLREGAFYRVNALSGISSPVTASVYVKGAGVVRLRMIDNPRGMEWSTASLTLSPNRWIRLYVTGFITGSNDVRLYIETNEGTAKARTFYVDDAQMELKVYPTTYCDGDKPGCRWNGLFHSSTSQRAEDTREGGRWVQLAGEDRQEEDLYMTVVGGLGMASLNNQTQSFALAPGSHFDNYKINARTITLTFHTKNVSKINSETTISLGALHTLRQFLIDLIKPDKTWQSEDIWFEYQDGDIPLYFQARYDGGLEGEWDVRNQWVNSFPLRLLAVSPLMIEDNQQVSTVDFQDTIPINNIAGRVNGQWINMNYGFNYYLAFRGMVFDKFGGIYAIADTNSLTVINNNAAAINPLQPARAVIYWNGEYWSNIGTATNMGGSGILYGLAISPTGDLYVSGNFTSIGGVAANHVAKWNGSSWSALGTGLNGSGRVVKVDSSGKVYVGGEFTTAGGVTCYRIAWYDGTWHQLGTYRGLDGTVLAIAIESDGSIVYVGGQFLNEQGIATNLLKRVAMYDTSTGTFSVMSSGFDSNVNILKIAPNRLLYAGGEFTSPSGIAVWSGGAWSSIGNSVMATSSRSLPITLTSVADMDFFSNGDILVAGTFSSAHGEIRLTHGIWNGSTWIRVDGQFNFTSTPGIGSCLVSPFTDDYYIASNATNAAPTMKFSGRTDLNNTGSASIHPSIYAVGPGRLLWVENQTTHKRVFLDLDMLNTEEVFIDFGTGTIKSSVRGDILHVLMGGSDFHSFELIPGENSIACFMINDVGAQLQMGFTPRHWAVDATG